MIARMIAPRGLSDEQRFMFYVSALPDGCWTWNGTKSWAGYGLFWYGGRTCHAHRYSYQLFVGRIPNGLCLDHLCRNRACVRPDHLEPVTLGENTLRGETLSRANANKTHCNHGHPLTGANLRVDQNGWRYCRTCGLRHRREQRERLAKARA